MKVKAQGAEPFCRGQKPSGKKAQGAIEYLLIIAAAIVIVAIVISVMGNGITQGRTQGATAQADRNTQMIKLDCLKDCNVYGACQNTQTGCGQFTDICATSNGGTCLKR